MISIEEKKIVLELAKKYRESAMKVNEINEKISHLKELVDKEMAYLVNTREVENKFVKGLADKYEISEQWIVQELQKIMMTDG